MSDPAVNRTALLVYLEGAERGAAAATLGRAAGAVDRHHRHGAPSPPHRTPLPPPLPPLFACVVQIVAKAPAVAATALATAGSFAARAASMSAAVTAKALSASPAGTATTAATAATGTVPAPPRVHTSCSAEANAEFELGELGEPPLLRIISSNTLMVASA
eukprot:6179643-Pleurochrysis_carterae.AAC.2